MTVRIPHCYDKRSTNAIAFTKFVRDGSNPRCQNARVLDHDSFVALLRQMIADGRTSNAAIGRIAKLPSSRVSEIFSGKRRVQVDEMKALIEELEIEDSVATPAPETLEPILDAIVPLVPPSGLTDQSRRALAVALSYGLELLGNRSAIGASPDALQVAARGAVSRFRELTTGL